MYIKPEGVRRAKSPSYAYTIPQQLGSSIMQVPTRAGGKLSGHRGYILKYSSNIDDSSYYYYSFSPHSQLKTFCPKARSNLTCHPSRRRLGCCTSTRSTAG